MSRAVGSLVVSLACLLATLHFCPTRLTHVLQLHSVTFFVIAIYYVWWARVSPPLGPSGLGVGVPGFEVQIWPFSPHSITLALRSCVSSGNAGRQRHTSHSADTDTRIQSKLLLEKLEKTTL